MRLGSLSGILSLIVMFPANHYTTYTHSFTSYMYRCLGQCRARPSNSHQVYFLLSFFSRGPNPYKCISCILPPPPPTTTTNWDSGGKIWTTWTTNFGRLVLGRVPKFNTIPQVVQLLSKFCLICPRTVSGLHKCHLSISGDVRICDCIKAFHRKSETWDYIKPFQRKTLKWDKILQKVKVI